MDEPNYTDLLILQSAEQTARTPFCPDDEQIAEYFDGDLQGGDRSSLEHHLADCRFCLDRIGMLQRLDDDRTGKRVPGDVLAAAKAMARRPVRRSRLAPAWAAAAVLVIAVGLLWQSDFTWQGIRSPGSSAGDSNDPNVVRQTRTIDPAAVGPRLLSPVEGLAVIPVDYLFRWTPVPASRFYQVRIVSEDGDLLWQERVAGTEWKLPVGFHPEHGAEYFMRVEAFLGDTRALKSDYLAFRVEERR